jgi:hypothetical protein
MIDAICSTSIPSPRYSSSADPDAKRAPPSLPAGIEDLSAKQFDNIFRLDRISVVE